MITEETTGEQIRNKAMEFWSNVHTKLGDTSVSKHAKIGLMRAMISGMTMDDLIEIQYGLSIITQSMELLNAALGYEMSQRVMLRPDEFLSYAEEVAKQGPMDGEILALVQSIRADLAERRKEMH